ncbi:MAG TPA: protein kinase [Acidobacteriota bacterium]|nr:protein kinase [Acidobacteriota bacterium]
MQQEIRVGEWTVRPELNLLERDGRRMSVEPRAIQLLLHLIRHAGEVCSRDELLEEVWGGAFVSDEALSNAVAKLRKALGDDPRDPAYIQTIPKRGYRLLAEVEWEQELQGEGEESPQEERFEIMDKIGEGRMGEVFLARDRVLRRRVALKLLTHSRESSKAVRRMLREARVAASLQHPGICSIFDCGELQGRPYIAMEYLEGRTLQQRLQSEHRLPPEEVLQLADHLCEALDAAHQRGILHRGLSPSNLMITPEGSVKIMDFGQARRLPHSQAPDQDWSTTLSEVSDQAGEYAYRSPEQITSREDLDVRSDVFSLGLILYECLCGRHAFQGETAVETAVSILSDPPPREADFPSRVPSRLRKLVLQMLSRQPDQRPPSMRALGRRLSEIQSPAPRHGRLVWAIGLMIAAAVLLYFAVLAP